MDHIGSSIFFGMIMLVVLGMNTFFMDSNCQNNAAAANLETVAGTDGFAGVGKMIDFDFYKIGFRSAQGVVLADTNRITLKGDINNDGVPDSVRYFLKTLTSTGTNYLLRTVNTQSCTTGGLPVSLFRLTYFDAAGRLITFTSPTDPTALSKIRSIRIQLRVENLVYASVGGTSNPSSAVYWEKIISPKNLRNVK